jgi:ribosomal protein S12 methylthiotransferase
MARSREKMEKTNQAAPRGYFFVENLGCAKNQVDAESIVASLESQSWARTESADTADMIIVNSCGFVEEARKESIDVTLSFRQLYPGKRIVLAGCLTELRGAQLAEIMPEIDGVFGNRAPSRITEIVDDVLAGKRPVFLPEEYENTPQGSPELSMKGSAYLKIAEGCDNRCSYCSIPLIRGGLRSRPAEAIVDDAARLIGSGVREINVIAQDLGSYGHDLGARRLPELLRSILEIPGSYWLRLLYIHPDRFPMDILDICKHDPRLLPYFDIPVQHGSARILKLMGRSGDGTGYTALAQHIREELPDAVLRSTFLIGFPGETRRDFGLLRELQDKAKFDWLGAFSYSREEGTVAYGAGILPAITHRIARPLVKRRVDEVQSVQREISETMVKRFVGRTVDVLIEERIEGEELFLGRMYAQAPDVDGLVVVHGDDFAVGTFVECRIIKANGIDLEATPV